MQHLNFQGSNIYLWHHVLYAMAVKGQQQYLEKLLPVLKTHQQDLIPSLISWFTGEQFQNRDWLIIELMRG
jgi:hypothetical protein